MSGKSQKDGGPHYASPACYAHEVDPDYLWAPDGSAKHMIRGQDGAPVAQSPDEPPPKASRSEPPQ